MAKKSKVKRTSSSSMPWGVKVISILNYVVFIFLLLSGLIFLIAASTFSSSENVRAMGIELFEEITGSTTISTQLMNSIPTLFVGLGLISLALCVLFFFLARGLWKGQNWARIVVIIISVIGFVGALADIIRGNLSGSLIDLVIDGLIAGYLLFNNRVKVAFSR